MFTILVLHFQGKLPQILREKWRKGKWWRDPVLRAVLAWVSLAAMVIPIIIDRKQKISQRTLIIEADWPEILIFLAGFIYLMLAASICDTFMSSLKNLEGYLNWDIVHLQTELWENICSKATDVLTEAQRELGSQQAKHGIFSTTANNSRWKLCFMIKCFEEFDIISLDSW
jgi:hypothetical protein